MKRAVFVLGLIALFASAAPASAQLGGEQREEKYLQVPHRFQLFMDGGIGMPAGPGLFKISGTPRFSSASAEAW